MATETEPLYLVLLVILTLIIHLIPTSGPGEAEKFTARPSQKVQPQWAKKQS